MVHLPELLAALACLYTARLRGVPTILRVLNGVFGAAALVHSLYLIFRVV